VTPSQRQELIPRIDALGARLRWVAILLEHEQLYRKALASERAAQVGLSLHRVRDEILRMKSGNAWVSVLDTLYKELTPLVDFHGCSIILVSEDGEQSYGYYWLKGTSHTGFEIGIPSSVEEAMRRGRPLYRNNPSAMRKWGDSEELLDAGIRCVVDVPFASGTIAMNDLLESAFDQDDIDILQRFALVLSEAHRRLRDLETLELKARELQHAQKMEAVGQLTAGIAHNFNNMLQGVIGNLELALADAVPEKRKHLDTALVSAERAADMVQQLLMFTRQDTRRVHRLVDLRDVLNDAMALCRRTFDRKLSLEMDIAGPLPVMGDSMQLHQVFLNLLINARDAFEDCSRESPVIGVSALPVSVDHSQTDEIPPGSYIRVCVTDNGQGMDEETRSKVFQPFFTTKSVDQGTGLGLSTAFGIVQDHDGRILCDSDAVAETRFTVYLPAAVPSEAAAPPSSPAVQGSETVLIVDDEQVVRDTAGQMLTMNGYEVLYAADGREGIEQCRQHGDDIDIILLDQSMPRMSGREVLAELRVSQPHLKVVIFTGFAADIDEFAGADDLIAKPFSLRRLVAKVREVLDRPS
jgi:signal transduction histidine kinase